MSFECCLPSNVARFILSFGILQHIVYNRRNTEESSIRNASNDHFEFHMLDTSQPEVRESFSFEFNTFCKLGARNTPQPADNNFVR